MEAKELQLINWMTKNIGETIKTLIDIVEGRTPITDYPLIIFEVEEIFLGSNFIKDIALGKSAVNNEVLNMMIKSLKCVHHSLYDLKDVTIRLIWDKKFICYHSQGEGRYFSMFAWGGKLFHIPLYDKAKIEKIEKKEIPCREMDKNKDGRRRLHSVSAEEFNAAIKAVKDFVDFKLNELEESAKEIYEK